MIIQMSSQMKIQIVVLIRKREPINFILMNNNMYHTIDPVILETLNLNEGRMNHILDILHGRPPKKYSKTQRKVANYSMMKEPINTTINDQEHSLPKIMLNKRRQTLQATQHVQNKTYRQPNNAKISKLLLTNQSQSSIKLEEKQLAQTERHKRSDMKTLSPKQARQMHKNERTPTKELGNIDEEVRKLQDSKRQQLMKDYMRGKLKRSRSQEINPKDVYRIEIQALLSEMIPIEGLLQAEKRINRLKRRYRHLHTFDKEYYSKLNQHDMLVLS